MGEPLYSQLQAAIEEHRQNGVGKVTCNMQSSWFKRNPFQPFV